LLAIDAGIKPSKTAKINTIPSMDLSLREPLPLEMGEALK